MEIMIDMPMIKSCEVSECTYNLNSTCHAKAITIGDGVTPGCDTFMKASGHVRNKQIKAGVGACKIAGCNFNSDFECSADTINVGHEGGKVICMTYMPG